MLGNVWEWTHSLFKLYPYNASDGREDEKSSDVRVRRGGPFNSNETYTNSMYDRCTFRNNDPGYESDDNYFYCDIGFRVVASPVLP